MSKKKEPTGSFFCMTLTRKRETLKKANQKRLQGAIRLFLRVIGIFDRLAVKTAQKPF
jgi:hypothetical protein